MFVPQNWNFPNTEEKEKENKEEKKANLEQLIKEVKEMGLMTKDSEPDFSDFKVEWAWGLFEHVLKEKLLPILNEPQMLHQYNYYEQFGSLVLGRKYLYPKFKFFLKLFISFCDYLDLNPQDIPDMACFQSYLSFCQTNKFIPYHGISTINTNAIENFKKGMENSQNPYIIPNSLKKKELIPNKEEKEEKKGTLYVTEKEMENYIRKYKMEGGANSEGDIINVTLTSISGFSVVIPAPGNMSFKDLFSTYKYEVKKKYKLENETIFLYNGQKLDTKSTNPINTLFKNSNAIITVIEQQNFVGA